MSTLKSWAVAGLALTALWGCSKSSNTAQAPATAEGAQPAGPVDYGTATNPGSGKLKLDISVDGGKAIYGDPTAGKEVFNQCVSCHSAAAGENKVGPSLHAIIGRKAGAIPGFRYSDANKNSGKVWSEQELYTYLANPQKEVPGTYMTFIGVQDPQKRADVIAYLQENTK
jgi:cytochrome c